MALILALGTLGVGYAAWTDKVTIGGTVNTGTLDVVVEYLSFVEVWKDLDPQSGTYEEAVAVYYAIDADTGTIVWQEGTVPEPGVKVAWTTANLVGTAEDDAVTFSFNNLFPCDWFVIDVKIHCDGSVPVKLNEVSLESDVTDDWIDDLIASENITYEMYYWDNVLHEPLGPYIEGDQLENCEWIIILIWVHIPQDDIYQAASGDMTMTVDFVQWNEYPYSP
jgi:predicted ribosomally synthesized peptide with SipW-like signal peptide